EYRPGAQEGTSPLPRWFVAGEAAGKPPAREAAKAESSGDHQVSHGPSSQARPLARRLRRTGRGRTRGILERDQYRTAARSPRPGGRDIAAASVRSLARPQGARRPAPVERRAGAVLGRRSPRSHWT